MKRFAAALSLVAGLASLAPSIAHAGGRRCVEVSDVVGDQKCSSYGDSWSIERRPPLTFRFGARYAQVSTEGMSFTESFKKKDRPSGYVGYEFPGEALGVRTLSALGVDGGLALYLVDQLYLGVECGLLLGSTRAATFKAGSHTLSDAGGVDVVLAHGGASLGYRVPLGRASIRGEALLGGVVADVASAAVLDGQGVEEGRDRLAGLIEPRVAADVWFTQHLSFGAYAGTNALDARGQVFGLSLTWHNRAFDGDMSLW